MARFDYTLEEARTTMENIKSGCDETVIIVEQFPDIDYVLAYRGGAFQPWVAAWGYRKEINCWAQGHYFLTLADAMEFIRTKKGYPNWYRVDEIATKTMDKLIENDPYEAEEFFSDELDITLEEAEYFGIGETLDMVKGYEED